MTTAKNSSDFRTVENRENGKSTEELWHVQERENLMKMIYQMSIQDDFSAEEYEKFTELQADSDITEYFVNGYRAVAKYLDAIDEKINTYSVKWKASRLPKVDLAILRLSMAELYYLDDIPVSVSINEAVELAKKYSTEKSSSFINGVLGSAARELSK